MFRMGLSEDMEPYVFNLIQGAKSSKRTLTVDDMLTALADHYKRHQYQEDNTKALKARVKSRDRARCEHCDKPGHTKEGCWNLHPEQVPKWAKEKARWNASKNSSGVKIMRSM